MAKGDMASSWESINGLINLVSASYQWTLSASGTNEYYCEAAAGGDPVLTEPNHVYENDSELTVGTMGSLSVSEWGWGDNDTLAFNTVYVRLSDGTDPDTKSSEYVECTRSSAYLDIQPASTIEWSIYNIKVPSSKKVHLYATDGTNEEKIDEGIGGWLDFIFKVKNGEYLRVLNFTSSSAFMGYDGTVTKI